MQVRSSILGAILLFVLPPLVPALSQDPANDAVAAAMPAELAELFPVGREFKGVMIPSYEEDVLQSVMRADRVKRIDAERLQLYGLTITIYGGEAEQESTVITTDHAIYYLLRGQLMSQTPARVTQANFTMTGNQLIFLTHTQMTRLVGDVRVVVPDAGAITAPFEPASPESGEDPETGNRATTGTPRTP